MTRIKLVKDIIVDADEWGPTRCVAEKGEMGTLTSKAYYWDVWAKMDDGTNLGLKYSEYRCIYVSPVINNHEVKFSAIWHDGKSHLVG